MKENKDHMPHTSEDIDSGADNGASTVTTQVPTEENNAEIDIDDLKMQLQKASSDYLYLRAEFDNFRKQSIKERSELLRFGGERLAKDLLDTLDIFETALATDVNADNLTVFVAGIKMTAQQLSATLEKHGIKDVPCEGKPFDPMINEALGSEPTDAVTPGCVTKVFKKPYKYHDKVLRVGQVIIATNKV